MLFRFTEGTCAGSEKNGVTELGSKANSRRSEPRDFLFSSYSVDRDLGICEGLERWRKKTGYIKRTASASCGLVAPWSLEGGGRADSVEKWGIESGRMRSLG